MDKRKAAAPVAPSTAAPSGSATRSRSRARAGRESSVPAASKTLKAFQVNCLMNARYHAAREAFLDNVHRWFMFGVIASGAGAVTTVAVEIAGTAWLNTVLGAFAAILGALDLTFDLSNRARSHALMKRRYFELLADVEGDDKTIAEGEVCLRRYCADEEPAYHALLIACWNAANESVYGDEGEFYDIPRLHQRFHHLFRFEGVQYGLKRPTQPVISASS